jgi:hypothetical protein
MNEWMNERKKERKKDISLYYQRRRFVFCTRGNWGIMYVGYGILVGRELILLLKVIMTWLHRLKESILGVLKDDQGSWVRNWI